MEAHTTMITKFFSATDKQFTDHPKFSGVQMAVFVTGNDTDSVSACQLNIEPGIAIPVHTHAPQVDSIFIVSGQGEGYVNGDWRELFREITSLSRQKPSTVSVIQGVNRSFSLCTTARRFCK